MEKFEGEQITYEGTPFSFIKKFLEELKPKSNQIVYDLGCGFGRVIIYGALNSQAQFKGIELVPERVHMAEKIRDRLHLNNAKFYCSNVNDFDYSDGDIFFLFNPFSPKTLHEAGDKLREISENKPIKIATWGGSSNNYFNTQNWLKKTSDRITLLGNLEFFESV